jgi:hypothetical protein
MLVLLKDSVFVSTKDRVLDEVCVSREIDRLLCLAADLRAIRDGFGPTTNDLSDAPTLNSWRLEVRPDPCLVGHVAAHPLLPGNGRPVITSDLCVLAEHQGWARKLSRWHLLGRRLPTA